MILNKKVLISAGFVLLLPVAVLLAVNDEWLCLGLLAFGVVLCVAAVLTLPTPIGGRSPKRQR
ncbi:hypothetical protein BCM14_0920 [Jezberella montanilacus]|jgi:O-antigen/teichoic acid export membrane protein|uniref:Uncharacterized protein n=1 Tax=Jezberella montanilacus TaxID=323426 RepID=A0A2T0XKI8_9BURK|nr:hypothetical protein [Jezberella montanilacus]PRY99474.1 hypothetical protein BCM14_0920 [Jezberella montanilacus]